MDFRNSQWIAKATVFGELQIQKFSVDYVIIAGTAVRTTDLWDIGQQRLSQLHLGLGIKFDAYVVMLCYHTRHLQQISKLYFGLETISSIDVI